jgi:hypothetical protein
MLCVPRISRSCKELRLEVIDKVKTPDVSPPTVTSPLSTAGGTTDGESLKYQIVSTINYRLFIMHC